MKFQNVLSSILFSGLLLLASFSPALADEEVRKLEVDLKGKGFTQGTWENNLERDKILFAPNDKFQVKLSIKNLGNRTQTKINVSSKLPSTLISDQPLNFKISQIKPGEEVVKTYTINVRDKSRLLSAVSKSEMTVTAKSEIGTSGQDWLYIYTNGGNLSPKATASATATKSALPATGNNGLVIGTSIALALAFAAFKLRAFVRGY